MNIHSTIKNTCCFTGHRPGKLPWKNDETDPNCRALKRVLADVLAELYEDGYRCFICGMAAGADIYFGEAVLALRSKHPDVILEAAVPYLGQERRWNSAWRQRYYRLAGECDRTTVLHQERTPNCMMDRNRYMVTHSSLLIAAYDGRSGGTRNTIRFAAEQGLQIIELPLEGLCANEA